MDIFEKLWNGKIYIAENSVPHTEEYRKAARALSKASESLESVLTEQQKAMYEAYLNSHAEVETLIQINVYRQGVKFGFELARELAEKETDKNDR